MAIEEGKALITLELDASKDQNTMWEQIENDLQPSVVRYEIVTANIECASNSRSPLIK